MKAKSLRNTATYQNNISGEGFHLPSSCTMVGGGGGGGGMILRVRPRVKLAR